MNYKLLIILLLVGTEHFLPSAINSQTTNNLLLPGASKYTKDFFKSANIISSEEFLVWKMNELRLSETSSSALFEIVFNNYSFNSIQEMGFPKELGPRIAVKTDSSFVGYFHLRPFPENMRAFRNKSDSALYFNSIKADVAVSLGQNMDSLICPEILTIVNRCPPEILKLVNAEAGFYYSIKNLKDDSLFETYRNCDVLVFSHEKNGFFMLYCFFTDEGYEKADYYKSMVLNAFRFLD